MPQTKGIEIKDNQHLTAVTCADDIILLAETDSDLKNSSDILMKEGEKIGLKINETKTKYMIVSRQNHRTDSLKVNDHTYERVRNFKYLGADINEDANGHEKVKRRHIVANRCYYGLLLLFKSKLLSRKSKVTLYKVLVKPIALYASSTWATTKAVEKKLEVFGRKILRKIFGPERKNEREYVIRSNKNVKELYNKPSIVGTLKSVRLDWVGHVWRSKELIGQITAWKPNTKTQRKTETKMNR